MGDAVTLKVLRSGKGFPTTFLCTDKATVVIVFPGKHRKEDWNQWEMWWVDNKPPERRRRVKCLKLESVFSHCLTLILLIREELRECSPLPSSSFPPSVNTHLLCRSNLDILVKDQPQPSESQTKGLSPGKRTFNF